MSGDPGPAVAAPTQQPTQAPAQGAEHAGGGEHAGAGGHDTSFSSKGPIPPVAAGGSAAPGKPSASDQAYGAHHADKPKKKAPPAGFTKSGGGRVKDALVRIANAGKLKITAHQIAQLDALSNVETGGSVASIDTTDDMVVSIGFHQVVLGHKSVEWVIQQAPAAFAKHGIELDMSKTYNVPGWSKPHQIKGVEDPDDLRGHEWGDRFYAASLEDEVIAAIAEWALKEAARVDVKAEKAGAKGNFWQDDTAHAWVLEVDNNREAYTGACVKRAVAAGANSAKDRDEFLDILAGAIIETYEDLEPKIVGYRKLKEKHHDWDDAKLHSEAERIYRPIGKTKATHIVERIPRKIKVPELNVAAAAPAPAPSAAAPPPAQTATAAPAHQDAPVTHTPPPVAHHEPAPPPAPAQHAVAAPPPVAAHHEVHAAAGTSTVSVPGPLRVKATGLNVRSTPNTEDHGNIIGGLHHGAQLHATGREGEWIAIDYEGRRAFVHGNFVEAMPAHEHEAASVAHVEAPAAHHDAPAAHHDAPQVAARPSPAPTRAHHDAPAATPHTEAAPTQHATSTPAAHHETAAPTPAPQTAPTKQADYSEAVRSQYNLLLNLVELGFLAQDVAITQLTDFDRGLHGGQLSPTGRELIAGFPKAVAKQTKPAPTAEPPAAAHTAAPATREHHDAPADVHHDAPAPTPAVATTTPIAAPPTKTAAPATTATTAPPAGSSYLASYTSLGGTRMDQLATSKDEAKILNALRGKSERFDPAWLVKAQRHLGVTETGAMNTETLRKMLHDRPGLDADKIVADDGGYISSLAPGKPFIKTEEGFGEYDEKDRKAAHGATKADQAARRLGYKDYDTYWAELQTDVWFLGAKLAHGNLHPHMVQRLAVAEAWIKQRHPEAKTDEALQKAVGWSGVGNASYDDDKKLGKSHFHTMGLAIDIDRAHNPYVFTGRHGDVNDKDPKKADQAKADDWWMSTWEKHTKYAAKIYGGEGVSAATMNKWAATMSSDELWAHLHASSEAWRQYLVLAKNPTRARQEFDAHGLPTADLADLPKLNGWWHNNWSRDEASSLTNISQELLIALRDVAGLSWGGAEMSSNENGDFMHFDCRQDTFGKNLFDFNNGR